MQYDFLIVGAGLCGAVLADRLHKAGASVVVVEKRPHVGGNLYCETIEGITVHRYGAHIFRTSDPFVWSYVNEYVHFNRFINSPIANYEGELYNLPFNMNTFYQLFGARSPKEAKAAIEADRIKNDNPSNLEEYVLDLVGKTIYEKLIKGYTEKQWGKPCTELPSNIMRRIPLRLIFDNNYFNDTWQGIPVEGYNVLIERMLENVPVMTSTDYLKNRESMNRLAKRIIYTGPVDALFNYCYGKLEYRSLRFEDYIFNENNAQGVAVVNYTSSIVPFTRTIEHKHFLFGDNNKKTVVTQEYPAEWNEDAEPYYPLEDIQNRALYSQYKKLAEDRGYILCGRLAEYRYYDMQDTIASAFALSKSLCKSCRQ